MFPRELRINLAPLYHTFMCLHIYEGTKVEYMVDTRRIPIFVKRPLPFSVVSSFCTGR